MYIVLCSGSLDSLHFPNIPTFYQYQVFLISMQLLQSCDDGGGEPERAGVQKRRRLWRKTGPPAPICHEPIQGYLPCMLAAALPRLSGALVKDHRGLCVLPHPHRMEQKILTNGQSIVTAITRHLPGCRVTLRVAMSWCDTGCCQENTSQPHEFRKAFSRGVGDTIPEHLDELVPDEGHAAPADRVAQRLDSLVVSPVSSGLTGKGDRDQKLVELMHLNSQVEGYWRLMPDGRPVGTIKGSRMVWDSNYEAEASCALQFLGRGVMMVLDGQTFHGTLTLRSGTPVIHWNDGEVWYRSDNTECCRLSS
eukprot:s1694_g29.t1